MWNSLWKGLGTDLSKLGQYNEYIYIYIYVLLYHTIEGTGDLGRIEHHNVRILCTLMLSGNYNDRGGRNEN